MRKKVENPLARNLIEGYIGMLRELSIITKSESQHCLSALNSPKLLLSKSEAAKELGVSISTLENYIRSGRLQAYKLNGKTVRIKREDINRMLIPVEQTDSLL